MFGQESQNSGLQTLFSHGKADDVHDVKKVYGDMSHKSKACLARYARSTVPGK